MLRDGYSFEDYEELKEMREESMAKAAVTRAGEFKSDIAGISFLATSSNRTTLENMEMDANAVKKWGVAKIASYDQLK